MPKILSIIAPEGYQDIEYNDSKDVLEKNGNIVVTSSTVGVAHGKYDGTQKIDILLKDVIPDEYDAVLFVGGPGSHVYFEDPMAQELARNFFILKKHVTAICAAPSILANAGLLKEVKATCFPDQIENLKSKGAFYTPKPVVIDGLFITADGPKSAVKFGQAISKMLKHAAVSR